MHEVVKSHIAWVFRQLHVRTYVPTERSTTLPAHLVKWTCVGMQARVNSSNALDLLCVCVCLLLMHAYMCIQSSIYYCARRKLPPLALYCRWSLSTDLIHYNSHTWILISMGQLDSDFLQSRMITCRTLCVVECWWIHGLVHVCVLLLMLCLFLIPPHTFVYSWFTHAFIVYSVQLRCVYGCVYLLICLCKFQHALNMYRVSHNLWQ